MKINRAVLAGVATAALVVTGATAAAAAAFINGDFESCTGCVLNPRGFDLLAGGSSQLTGWTVVGGHPNRAVDYVGHYWMPESGSDSLALSGAGGSGVSQTFSTIVGEKYDVKFYISGAPNPTVHPIKTIAVTAGSAPTMDYNFNASNNSLTNMGWQVENYDFTATSTSTTLSFVNDPERGAGPAGQPYRLALDNVSVTAVPEPATWAMMILGFGFAGSSLRSARGNRAVAAA